MTADELEEVLVYLNRRRPFRHYFIELHSGERFEVRHPEVIRRFGNLFAFHGHDRSRRVFHPSAVSEIYVPPPGP